MMTNAFDGLLLNMVKTPVEQIKPFPARSYSLSGVLHAELDQPLKEVFANLEQQHVLSLPIVSKSNLKHTNSFIDLWDIARYLGQTFVDYHYVRAN